MVVRLFHLAPLAGRGRPAKRSEVGRVRGTFHTFASRKFPLTPTLSPQAGRGSSASPAVTIRSALQNYGVNMAAVIGLRPMHRAAIAEEALVGIGVDAEVIDYKHAGIFKPLADQSGQIEHRVAFAPGWNEKDGIVGVVLNKAFDEFVADLVGVLADQRPDRRNDVGALRAKLLHRADGGLDDSGERAFPAGMRGGDHACLRID